MASTEARAPGEKLKAKKLSFDVAYTSALIRAQNTLKLMLDELGQSGLEEHRDQALNERDYGDLAGLNKDDARKKWGEEQVHIWRRSYDANPPGGESLRDTGARVWPYYLTRILPDVMRGRRVLVSAHGNSLRSLVMVLDKLGPDADHQARARHRRAAGLPAERRHDGRGEADPHGLRRRVGGCASGAPGRRDAAIRLARLTPF